MNLDKFNTFLLGLHFCTITAFLSGLLLLQAVSRTLTGLQIRAVIIYFAAKPQKPPGNWYINASEDLNKQSEHCGLLAYSSSSIDTLPTMDFYTEAFEDDEEFIIGLDSISSRHLFPEKFWMDNLPNTHYTPKSPVHLISILQLARGTQEKSWQSTGECKSNSFGTMSLQLSLIVYLGRSHF